MPLALLGPAGYFTREQQNLEAIRLVTDASCPVGQRNDRGLALSAFPRLKSVSWAGISTDLDLETLADVLKERSGQLEDLEIDLSHHRNLLRDQGLSDEDVDPEFANRILRLPRRSPARFLALKKLSLAAVSLAPGRSAIACERTMAQISNVFDFDSLQSLKLRFCKGWKHLVLLLARRAEPLRLKSLTIEWSLDDDIPHSQDALVSFLRGFKGLEELYLYNTYVADQIQVWAAVLHHGASLRRFVHHQRSMLREGEADGPGQLEYFHDAPWIGYDPLIDYEYLAHRVKYLGKLDLVSLGLCCTPYYLVRNNQSARRHS